MPNTTNVDGTYVDMRLRLEHRTPDGCPYFADHHTGTCTTCHILTLQHFQAQRPGCILVALR